MTNTLPASETTHSTESTDVSASSADAAATKAKRRRAKAAADTACQTAKPGRPEAAKSTKTEAVVKKLRSAKGVTIEALMEATGWQAHSVRGLLSGTVKKKLGLTVLSEAGKDGVRRYRITDQKAAD
jgi:hypothetical protein